MVHDYSALIQTVGFPIAIALALLFFAYKVYQYMVAQVIDKDAIIKDQIICAQKFNDRIIETQNKILALLDSRTELLHKVIALLELNLQTTKGNRRELLKIEATQQKGD